MVLLSLDHFCLYVKVIYNFLVVYVLLHEFLSYHLVLLYGDNYLFMLNV